MNDQQIKEFEYISTKMKQTDDMLYSLYDQSDKAIEEQNESKYKRIKTKINIFIGVRSELQQRLVLLSKDINKSNLN